MVERRHIDAIGILGQHLLAQIRVGFYPGGPTLDHGSGACSADFGDHDGFCAEGDNDCGGTAECDGGGDGGEACVSARGGVEVGEVRGWVSLKCAEDEIADAARDGIVRSGVMQRRMQGKSFRGGPHRDLKEPDGWRFSSFRKMRLDNENFS